MRAASSYNSQALEIVKFLVAKGADVNAVDRAGNTALMRAVGSSNAQALEIVKFLVEKGADVRAVDRMIWLYSID
jgi:ankyrin repeat protein